MGMTATGLLCLGFVTSTVTVLALLRVAKIARGRACTAANTAALLLTFVAGAAAVLAAAKYGHLVH